MSRGSRRLSEVDDLTAAQRLMEEMGVTYAHFHVTKHIERARATGDMDETRAWLRIKSALDALLQKGPPGGESTN